MSLAMGFAVAIGAIILGFAIIVLVNTLRHQDI